METWSFVSLFLFSAALVDSSQPPSLQEVLHRLETVEAKLKDSEKENAIQKDIIAEQSNAIKRLENEVGRLNDVVGPVSAKSRSNARDIKVLRSKFQRLLWNHITRSGKPETTNRNSKTIENRNAANINHPRRSQRQVGGGIAFTAYLDHDGDFGLHQTVVFNKIITNDGNGYNEHTGVFTCSEEGVYFFTFSIGQRSDSDGIKQLYADLVVNSQTVIDAVAETKYSTEDDQGSNSVVKRLKQGDSVWIRSRNAGHHVEGSSFRITSFTGMYMYA